MPPVLFRCPGHPLPCRPGEEHAGYPIVPIGTQGWARCPAAETELCTVYQGWLYRQRLAAYPLPIAGASTDVLTDLVPAPAAHRSRLWRAVWGILRAFGADVRDTLLWFRTPEGRRHLEYDIVLGFAFVGVLAVFFRVGAIIGRAYHYFAG